LHLLGQCEILLHAIHGDLVLREDGDDHRHELKRLPQHFEQRNGREHNARRHEIHRIAL
jgi:hypothetical protein